MCCLYYRNALDSEELAKKALQASTLNTKNKAVRSKIKPAPEKVVGVAEPFGDGEGMQKKSGGIIILLFKSSSSSGGDDAIAVVTLANFTELLMGDDRDVFLLLHAKNCEPCYHFAVYFKRVSIIIYYLLQFEVL